MSYEHDVLCRWIHIVWAAGNGLIVATHDGGRTW
jgi:hypothetical protein